MLPSFQVSVPADARYRVLAPEMAAKYAALAGCSEADAHDVLIDVEAAASRLSTAGRDIALTFGVAPGELVVTLSCGAESATVRRGLPDAR